MENDIKKKPFWESGHHPITMRRSERSIMNSFNRAANKKRKQENSSKA